ncbi:MAG TPA: DUF2846 domain-containing protein [Stellaceae bacterium]|nr:DUF2846 domain-containing protein [Stellaceae bacterium]
MKLCLLAVLALSALSLLSCTTMQCERPSSASPPAGLARFYFFRSGSVYDSQQWTAVSLNRQKVGDSAPGGVFYRDVPPGRYEIEVRSDKLYPNQFKTVVVAPGSTTYVAVQNLPHWSQGGWQTQGTTFAVSIVDPTLAVRQIAALCPTRG